MPVSSRRSDCVEIRKRCSDYLEGDVSEEEQEWVRSHLEECKNCDRFIASLGDTIRMLGELPSKAVSADLKERLLRISKGQGSGQA